MYVFVVGVVLVAGTAQTVTGFGFALVAVPLLVLALPPEEAVVLTALVAMVNAVLVARGVWTDVPWRTVGWLIAGSIAGMPLGLVVLVLAPEDALRLLVAVASVLMALALLSGLSFGRRGMGGELAAGAMSGVLNTSTGMNGPPIVLYLTDQRLTPPSFRGALSTFFFAGNALSLVLFASAGIMTRTPVVLAAVALPALLPATMLGHALLGRLSQEAFRYLVLVLLVLSASVAVAVSVARML